MNSMRDVLAKALSSEGAIVDLIEPEGLEIVAPREMQETLSIAEWSRVGFGQEIPERAERVGFESDWAEKVEKLLRRPLRNACVSLSETWAPASMQPMDKLLGHALSFSNATFRPGATERTRATYCVLAFRVTAVSDEKRDDVVLLCSNESSGAAADSMLDPLQAGLPGLLESGDARSDPDLPGGWTAKEIHRQAGRALPWKIRGRLAPFLAGMERRMARDLDRLCAYHSDLRNEAAARLSGRQGKGNPGETAARDEMRLQAIEREYQSKVADLKRKYAVTVEVRFLHALRVSLPVQRTRLTILRRKGSRDVQLDWNPLARKLDTLLCEGCGSAPRIYSVCDDRLHLLCPSCGAACASCLKPWCKACSPGRCPRCG